MLIRDKVKNLIKLGYDDDVIAMTLSISNDNLEAIKKEIQFSKEINETQTQRPVTKLQLLRDHYYRLYNAETEKPIDYKFKDRKQLTDEQRVMVERGLDEVETMMPAFLKMPESIKQRNQMARIREIYSKMKDLDLPSSLAHRAYKILQEDFLYKIRDRQVNGSLRNLIEKYKSKCLESFAYEIEITDDLDGLTILKDRLKSLSNVKYLTNSSLLSKINSKIQNIKMSNYKEPVDISEDTIKGLVESLANPSVSMESIQNEIKQNGLDYYRRKKKMLEEISINTNMALVHTPTEEGSIRQVSFLMTDYIRNGKIDIKDIDYLYQRLIDLGSNKSVVGGVILDNLLKKERFDDAETFADKTFSNNKDRIEIDAKKSSHLKIKKARIVYYIMKGIEAKEGEIEDEDSYFDTISRGIEQSKIDPSTIILGTSKDGKRKITWGELTKKSREYELEL